MSKLEIHIASRLRRINPHHRMVTHFDVGLGGITGLIHMGQYMHIGARILLVGVPLVILNNEGALYALHNGMLAVLDLHSAVALLSNIIPVANLTQEI